MLPSLYRRLRLEENSLFLVGMLHFSLAGICILLALFDPRVITGVNAWVKPLKFALSIAIFLWTMGCYLLVFPSGSLFRKLVRWSFIVSMVVEMILIAMQAVRGVPSHFNVATSFDAFVFGMMGTFIFYNTAIMLVLAIAMFWRKPNLPLSLQTALVAGLLISLFGSWMGTQMVNQMAHTVGAADGGTGSFLLNWSISHGDLRVAHFFGLHALQLLPLLAWAFAKWWGELPALLFTLTASLAYLAFVAMVYLQAKAGIPFLPG